MRLILIRHAIALPHGSPGVSEDERPLTPRGQKRFRLAAAGLARVVKRPEAVLTSPLLRARQTAEIAARAWGKLAPIDVAALATGDIEGLTFALKDHSPEARVALVGHEPHMSALLARLIGAGGGEPLTFRKGGAALVELPGGLEQGGTLLWYLPPRILMQLAR